MNDTSIKSASDLRTYIGLEDIGTIPDMWTGRGWRSRRRRGLRGPGGAQDDPISACIVTQHDPKSPVAEAYRSLRTNFQFATLRKASKTIMVTSSLPGEGKTTTAVNFAVTMSDLGKRVVIMDTDLRRPNVHRALGMKRGLGLADVLQNEAKLADVILPTQTENLWMISSGGVPPNPSELINSEMMALVMSELAKTFDVVICDAPSTLVVTDPVILATHVDCIILVVSVNRTRRETVLRAKKIIETANPKIAGAVLNGLKTTSRHYYYYYDEKAKRGRRTPESGLTGTFSETLSALDGVHAESEK
ncbi:MAG: CpsD/CapB family tyrosine-protein kinase [Candidatus Hydrogenedentes bacterium]|nr:CpsD/CapB family tyrosine-protein kinase [Candidatus Hydrogenedentota bacterium]